MGYRLYLSTVAAFLAAATSVGAQTLPVAATSPALPPENLTKTLSLTREACMEIRNAFAGARSMELNARKENPAHANKDNADSHLANVLKGTTLAGAKMQCGDNFRIFIR